MSIYNVKGTEKASKKNETCMSSEKRDSITVVGYCAECKTIITKEDAKNKTCSACSCDTYLAVKDVSIALMNGENETEGYKEIVRDYEMMTDEYEVLVDTLEEENEALRKTLKLML